MKKFRIICTVTNDLTYDQRMQRICASLVGAGGYEILLVGRRLPASKPLDNQPFGQKRLPCFFKSGFPFYVEINLRIFFFLLFLKFDAVCTVDLDTMPGGCSAALLRGKRRVFDAHEHFTEVPEVVGRPGVRLFWRGVARVFLRFYHRAYTVGPGLAGILGQRYGWAFGVVRNVPFREKFGEGKTPGFFEGQNSGEKAPDFGSFSNFRMLNGQPTPPKILLYQGALNEGRGIEQAIEAMPKIASPEVELWLAGEGDLSKTLREMAAASPARERIRFLGYVKPADLKSLTQQAWLGLNLLENRGLSYYFSLANKFFDYVQAAVPGLTMAFPEYRALCETHRVAVLLDELSPPEIAAAVNRLLKNETEYLVMQTACRAAAEVWNWEMEEIRLLEIWREVEILADKSPGVFCRPKFPRFRRKIAPSTNVIDITRHSMRPLIFTLLLLAALPVFAQPDRWQQRQNCEMSIEMDVKKHQYKGKQRLTYTNNSPDTLTRVFYHLFFNAFRPGSMMDVRNQNLEDSDPRVSTRISKLSKEEEGWLKVNSLTQNGTPVRFETNETILEVALAQPIVPGSSAILEMNWDAQVPLQIRRSGRDNREGVAYSMAQWYPKICEYDYQGWHANPYVGREFYGVWGDFDVKITIDEDYIVAAGGYLQNPSEIGNGYEDKGQKVDRPKGKTLTYHFKTPNVHDFVWAADPDYAHTKIKAADGTLMHFFWQKGKGYDDKWEKLPAIMSRARTLMNERFGNYPYREYYFIQAADGGMEYPLATLITGDRNLNSLVGVAVHEQLHSWYQMILGTNESLYAWMDEGFTSWAEAIVENELAREGLLPGKKADDNPFEGALRGYTALATSGKEEPMSTHADHFQTNYAYGLAAYVKGAVFLNQLGYVIGDINLYRGMKQYFRTWMFKHPNTNDFLRIMEKQSGLELDWYKEDFVNTTNTIDYAIKTVEKEGRKTTRVVIERIGRMAMPLDIYVTYDGGDKEIFYAPLESMRGEKPGETDYERTLLPDHRWVDTTFEFEIPAKLKKIQRIEIDPTRRMADIDYSNNVWEAK